MYASVNKSGCVVLKGNCQIRLDFFLEPADPRYADRYLNLADVTSPEYLAGYPGLVDEHGIPIDQHDYDLWWQSLPKIGVNTPFHSHFIYLPATFTKDDIEGAIALHLPNFNQAFQDKQDEVAGGMRHGWATETRIPPIAYSKADSAAEYAARVTACQARIDNLTEIPYKPPVLGEGKYFPATTIDIGGTAIDRAAADVGSRTTISLVNPANDTGTIDTFEVWAYQTISNFKAGMFSGAASPYTNRSGGLLGNVVSGAKRTFTGLSYAVVTGDKVGWFFAAATGESLELDSSGLASYYKAGDQFGTGPQAYALYGTANTWSVYGTGQTPTFGNKANMGAKLIAGKMI